MQVINQWLYETAPRMSSCIWFPPVIRYERGSGCREQGGIRIRSMWVQLPPDPHSFSYLTSYLFRAIVRVRIPLFARIGRKDEKSALLALIQPQPPERMAATF